MGTTANAHTAWLCHSCGRSLWGGCAESRKMIHCCNSISFCLSSSWLTPFLHLCIPPAAHLQLKPPRKAIQQQQQHPSALPQSGYFLSSHGLETIAIAGGERGAKHSAAHSEKSGAPSVPTATCEPHSHQHRTAQ